MRHGVFLLLVVLVLAFGAPRAGALLYWLMGSWSATGIEADGTRTAMDFGRNLPRPDWVPVPADASIVQGSRVVSKLHPQGFFGLEISTGLSLEEITSFYRDRLGSAGFSVSDEGIGTLTPAAAEFLGVAGSLVGERPATNDKIGVQIRTPEGLIFPTRLVQINWWKLDADIRR